MEVVRLFFFSPREHDRVERLELVVHVFLEDLRLGALAVGLVAHDLLRLVNNGIVILVGSAIGL